MQQQKKKLKTIKPIPNPIAQTIATNNSNPIETEITQTKNNWFYILVIFALAFLLYANTLGHGYAFDDSIVIVDNAFTKQGFGGIKDLITRDFFDGIYGNESMQLSGGRYRPLSLVMFAIEYEFFGLNPFVGHLLNVLFYAASCVLIYFLAKRWLSKFSYGELGAFLVALIFALHPIHTEVVANIKSRDEIMAVFFLVIALIQLDKFFEKGSMANLFFVGITFLLSMLSKENTFVYAICMPCILYVLYKNQPSEKKFLGLGLTIGAAAIYFALRYAMVGGFGAENPDIMENPFVNSDFNEKFGTIGTILLKYLGLIILPLNMASDYSFNQIPFVGLSNPLALLGWGLFAALGIGALYLIFKKKHYAGIGILGFIFALGPTTNILFNIGAPMADRFLYLSSFGSALVLGGIVAALSKAVDFKNSLKSLIALALYALLGVYSFITIERNPVWKDNTTLFTNDVNVSPNSAKMQYYYGNTILSNYLKNTTSPTAAQDLQKAENAFIKAMEINPKFHTAIYNLALTAWHQQAGEKAAKYCEMVLAIQPTHILTTELYGKVNARFLGNPSKGIQLLETAIYTYKSETVDNYSSLAIAYAMTGNLQKAIDLLEKALQLNDKDATVWQNYAAILSQMGRVEDAAKAMDKANALR